MVIVDLQVIEYLPVFVSLVSLQPYTFLLSRVQSSPFDRYLRNLVTKTTWPDLDLQKVYSCLRWIGCYWQEIRYGVPACFQRGKCCCLCFHCHLCFPYCSKDVVIDWFFYVLQDSSWSDGVHLSMCQTFRYSWIYLTQLWTLCHVCKQANTGVTSPSSVHCA